MSNELTVINSETQIAPGGVGVNFQSRFFKLKPATITINQPNTQADGAIKGHFRIIETGQQFSEMRVALLQEPMPKRDYFVGEQGQLNRKAENLMCFSRDMVKPHPNSKMPQALACKGCPRSDWEPFRKAKRDGVKGPALRSLIPPCDESFFALFVDTVLQLPMKMYIQSKSKGPFEAGMENLARTILMMSSQGLNPNIFDVSFTMKTEGVKNDNGTTSYVLRLSDFKAVTNEEKAKFGVLYQRYASVNQGQDDDTGVQAADAAVDKAVSGGPVEGEYVGEDEAIQI